MDNIITHGYLYRKMEYGIQILACRSLDHIAVIPEQIDGMPVVELGEYLFSEHRRETEPGIWSGGEELPEEELPELRGNRLTELYLPSTVKKIGKYACYNCERLERVSCYSTTLDWGAGAFTGCRGIRFLDLYVTEGEKSCFQDMISELRQTLYVTYYGKQEARLVFPEFYEEAVENTPARFLETHMHGCGHQYRYCFQQSEFQFQGYDSLFPYVQVQEREELVVDLALGRLRFPYGLTKGHEAMYLEYLQSHHVGAAAAAARKGDIEELGWLLGKLEYSHEDLAVVIAEAGKSGEAAVLSFLMEKQRGSEPPKRKRFQL